MANTKIIDSNSHDCRPIRIYTLQYTTPGGRRFFLPESLDASTASQIYFELEKAGRMPVVYQTEIGGCISMRDGTAVPVSKLKKWR